MKSRVKLPDAKKETLFAGLHSLLSAGLDFSRSFTLLITSENDRNLKQLLQTLYDGVVSGRSLWQAMEASGPFSALDYGVVRIGEQTGRIAEALQFLADYYRKRIAQRRMVISAVSYPSVILCTAIVVVIFMMLVIVPMFEQVYARMGGQLPALTQAIISLSKDFPGYSIVFLILTAAGITFFTLYGQKTKVRSVIAYIILRIPVAGEIVRKNQQAQLCKLLYLLISSGIPLLHGLEMLRDIITFYPYQASLNSFCDSLRKGELLYHNMERYPKLYDPKFTTLVRVGEETHRLPYMLQRQGEELTAQLEYSLKQLGSMLEPVLILFIGILVAVILISMYLPMFKLGGIMG